MARKKRGVPEINAGSMADIAFLLLIFFLVTTTMDVDSGLARKLPPIPEDLPETPPQLKEKNLFIVLVNAFDQLLVEGEPMNVEQLRDAAKDFLDNNGDGTCIECGGRRDPASSDNPDKAIISLQNDRGTSYEMYVTVQNELAAAYNELRDELAQRKHGKSYNELSPSLQKEIRKVYPQKISEAEPKDAGQ